jgi:hypothetical protein
MAEITKSAKIKSYEVQKDDINKINQLTLKELTEDEVFIFKLAICDNEVDRAYENFPLASLLKMKELFVGKTIIKDHHRTADNQVARIFDTELVSSEETTKSGEPYTQLVAKCYMLNDEPLVKEIQAGIKKEVSVSLAIGKATCSICGSNNVDTYCPHWPGQEYDGKTCTFALEEPADAYEVSFVAVPCQPNAGTTKAYGSEPAENEKELNNDAESLKLTLKNLEAFLMLEGGLKDE